MSYKSVYESWKSNPEAFWLELARGVDWKIFPETILNSSNPPFYHWFEDGLANTCYNAVDRHVLSGLGKKTAIIYDSPVTNSKEYLSYHELLLKVSKFGAALKQKGIKKGDRVIVYMPMALEAIIAMLACARIGAIHSVVFGGFAAAELAVRIDDATPKAILAGSCGLEVNKVVEYKPLLDEAISLAKHSPEFCVILQRPQCISSLIPGRDYEWDDFQKMSEGCDCIPIKGSDPLYILYTSGTTGEPKGVVRPSGGHMTSLIWTMKNLYGVSQDDVFWAASDVGWVVGHSYICYAPLLNGNTTVLFEGKPVGTPDAGTFWRVISEHSVSCLFTAPTAFRAIKREDPDGSFIKQYNMTSLKSLFLAGERADPDTIIWAQEKLQVPVIDHWWQTETGFGMVGNPIGIEKLPIKIGSPTVPLPGYEIDILDGEGKILGPNQLGSIAVKLPLPPGALPTLWNADDRFLKSYLSTFPGYYETGDAGLIDEDGYIFIMARTDDVINIAGHRLSTGAMEEVLASHKDVAECAVVGIADELKGQLPLGLLCLNSGVNRSYKEITGEVILSVREQIGPVAAFKLAVVVDRLPKTRSGKILRATIAKIANGEDFKTPATIDDPVIINEIRQVLKTIGLPKLKTI
ncbi:MAG: propionyl-CoA synthetase [Rhodobacteraceae bacterium]|nr:MAG: propionyl-CoA synthetase [Paracoccaceae bacterium]